LTDLNTDYFRSSIRYLSQEYEQYSVNLHFVAKEKGWHVRRTFLQKISGTVKTGSRNEFKSLIDYLEKAPVDIVKISEISRIAWRVVVVLNFVELLHEKGIALYIQ
jgi:DNA invertase Pin-like site-specific DNA recombinase